VLGVIGWGGLILLVFLAVPTLGPRWLFFFLFTLAFSGTSLPIVYFLNRRFPSTPPVDGNMVLREAMWCGVYFSLLAWLQMGRVLTSSLAFVLMVGLILVEFLLRLGERSQWSPVQSAAAPGTVAPAAGQNAGLPANESGEDETSSDASSADASSSDDYDEDADD
jgi:hypothetical protein